MAIQIKAIDFYNYSRVKIIPVSNKCIPSYREVQCARLWIVQSRFKPWPKTLGCFLGRDTLLSECLSPSKCIVELTVTVELNSGCNPVMDQRPIQGGVEILLMLYAKAIRISSGLVGHLTHMQTLYPKTRHRKHYIQTLTWTKW